MNLNKEPMWGLECIDCFNDKTGERLEEFYVSRDCFGMSSDYVKMYLQNITTLRNSLENEIEKILISYSCINKYIRPIYVERKRHVYMLYNMMMGLYIENVNIEDMLKKYLLPTLDFFIDRKEIEQLDIDDAKSLNNLLKIKDIDKTAVKKILSMYYERKELYSEMKMFKMECEQIGKKYFYIVKEDYERIYEHILKLDEYEFQKHMDICNENLQKYKEIDCIIRLISFNAISFSSEKKERLIFEIGYLAFDLEKREKTLSENTRRLTGCLKALGDTKRLEIMRIIKMQKETTINEIAKELNVSQKDVSYHMDTLIHNGIVKIKSNDELKEVFEINNEVLKVLGAEIISMCQ